MIEFERGQKLTAEELNVAFSGKQDSPITSSDVPGFSGVTITGTPSNGMIPIATDSTTGSWQNIPGIATRAQISSTRIYIHTFYVYGFSSIGDLGAGAVYTSIGATSNGLLAIQDVQGIWFNLVISSGIANVGWFGAVGDGTTDDRNAIQTTLDYLLELPLSQAKVCFFPAPSVGYLVNSGQTIHQKYPASTNLSTEIFGLFFPNAKNLTLRGEAGLNGGGVSIIVGSNLVANRIFMCANDANQPSVVYNTSSGYHTSLLATQSTFSLPTDLSDNWVTMTQGDITKFPVGDTVTFFGDSTLTAVQKIVSVDSVANKIYFERQITIPTGKKTFQTWQGSATGATILYVAQTILFRGQAGFPAAQMTLNITLDDSSVLSTHFVSVIDAGSITIANAVPAGRAVLAGATVAMTGQTGQDCFWSDTSRKYQLTQLVNDTTGLRVYPTVTANDGFWCVTPENITFENINLSGGSNYIFITFCYNFTLENCTWATSTGALTTLNTINGFNIFDSKIIQTSTGISGLQLASGTTCHICWQRSTIIMQNLSIGENPYDVRITDCVFQADPQWSASNPSAFLSMASYLDAVFTRCKVLVQGGYVSSGAHFISCSPQSSIYIGQDSLLFDDCEFEFFPGINSGTGLDQASFFAVENHGVNILEFRSCRFNIRYASGLYIGPSFSMEDCDINMIDCGFIEFAQINANPTPQVLQPARMFNIRNNKFTNTAKNVAVSIKPMWSISWVLIGSVGAAGYISAIFEGNLYDGFKSIFEVFENLSVNNGMTLSDVTITDERSVNNQSSFTWYPAGNRGIIPLAGIAPDGIRTWYSKNAVASILGGIINLGEQIIVRNGGSVLDTKTCTAAGAISGGAWSNSTDYQTDRWVTGSDSKIYMSLQASGPAGVGAKDPTSNPTYWQLMANQTAVLS